MKTFRILLLLSAAHIFACSNSTQERDVGLNDMSKDANSVDVDKMCEGSAREECVRARICSFTNECVPFDSLSHLPISWNGLPFSGTAVSNGVMASITISSVAQNNVFVGALRADNATFPLRGEFDDSGVSLSLGSCVGDCPSGVDASAYRFDGKRLENQWIFTNAIPSDDCSICDSPFDDAVMQPNDGIRPTAGSNVYEGVYRALPGVGPFADSVTCKIDAENNVLSQFECGGEELVGSEINSQRVFRDLEFFAAELIVDNVTYAIVGNMDSMGFSALVARFDGQIDEGLRVEAIDPNDVVGIMHFDALSEAF